jgi:hypothetical protein
MNKRKCGWNAVWNNRLDGRLMNRGLVHQAIFYFNRTLFYKIINLQALTAQGLSQALIALEKHNTLQ